ncbi:GDCCVxC domain-containing (seleno)protein [Polaribacter sp.]|uniref:GDCCVxC domain-containing (seleno)protein n=1 Tax=Polaribacter sp. TaxID=1920175 RepID=UPI0035C7D737
MNKCTLGEFIIQNQVSFPYSTGELSNLINAIRLATKVVNHEVNKAGLVDIIGNVGQFFYECENCKTVLKPHEGDCCVYCSYGTVPCPPIQENKSCC